MKILLVDDSPKHRKAGVEQLEALGHEVTALSSYTEAQEVVQQGGRFDVALLDLLMPSEPMTLGGQGLAHLGKPIDVGYSLSIKLALLGVSRIAVATDTNHHHHPASAIMDWFRDRAFQVNEATVAWMHAPMTEEGVKDWSKVLDTLLAV